MDVWADRTVELSALPGVAQVFPFENRGEEIGVTLHHPHGQIYGYPFVTPKTERMLATARDYQALHGRPVMGDVLAAERSLGRRVLATGEHWTAFVPAAARWPVEVHMVPHRQVPDIPALTGAERDGFADLYLRVLHMLTPSTTVRCPTSPPGTRLRCAPTGTSRGCILRCSRCCVPLTS